MGKIACMRATWKPHEKSGRLTMKSDLPDSVFAFPTQRKEPLTDARHVRNAIARFDQVIGPSDAERALAFSNIKKAAKILRRQLIRNVMARTGCASAAAPQTNCAKGRVYAQAHGRCQGRWAERRRNTQTNGRRKIRGTKSCGDAGKEANQESYVSATTSLVG